MEKTRTMFTVKTNFGQHRVVTSPHSKTYLCKYFPWSIFLISEWCYLLLRLDSQFPQDMRTVLGKLDSIESLLTQLVEITQAIEEQPAPKRARYEDVSQSAFGSVVQVMWCICNFLIIVQTNSSDNLKIMIRVLGRRSRYSGGHHLRFGQCVRKYYHPWHRHSRISGLQTFCCGQFTTTR